MDDHAASRFSRDDPPRLSLNYVYTLLIANRGAIACRILRTLRAMQVGAWPSILKPTSAVCIFAKPMKP
jgi:hypothetical protein